MRRLYAAVLTTALAGGGLAQTPEDTAAKAALALQVARQNTADIVTLKADVDALKVAVGMKSTPMAMPGPKRVASLPAPAGMTAPGPAFRFGMTPFGPGWLADDVDDSPAPVAPAQPVFAPLNGTVRQWMGQPVTCVGGKCYRQ